MNRTDELRTARNYAMFLLDVMPERTAEHYRNKIAVYLRAWSRLRGYMYPFLRSNSTFLTTMM